jgi:anti-sigma factor (TIGR02949 family)
VDCQEVQKFIHAFLDGEFDEQEKIAITAHLSACEHCNRRAQLEEAFRRKLKESFAATQAPPHLRASVEAALGDRRGRPAKTLLLRIVPAAAAVALVLGVLLTRQRVASPLTPLIEQSIAGHRQQLPMDIADPNPSTVQQFFRDKVPFAVRPPRFPSREVQLVGARLSNLREHQAVKVTYTVRGNRLTVFIFDPHEMPSIGRLRERDVTWRGHQGYNVAMYTSGGTGYAVTSDMEPNQLVKLIRLSR